MCSSTGIDGIIININPDSALQKDAALALLAKLDAMCSSLENFDLKVMVSYDDRTSDQRRITTLLTWVNDNIYNHISFSKHIFLDDATGHPVFLTWSESDPTHYYATIKSLFLNKVVLLVRNPVNFNKSDGNFEWVNYLNTDVERANTLNWGQKYFDDVDWLMARQPEVGTNPADINTVKMGAVYPGFDDRNVPSFWNNGKSRYIFRTVDAGDTLSLTWQRQIDYVSRRLGGEVQVDNPWIQIITWNDWAEGTSIEPATSDTYGYRSLDKTHKKIAQFKATSPQFHVNCLRIPFIIFILREAHNNVMADSMVSSALQKLCP